MRLRISSALVVVCLILNSCFDTTEYEIEGVDVNPSIAIPLLHGRVSIQDLLDDQDSAHVKIYPDGLVYLAYESELKTESIRDMFELSDQTFNRTFVVPSATIPPHNEALRKDSIVQQVSFNLDPERLDEIAMRGGHLNITTSILPENSPLDYEVHAYFGDFVSRTTNQPLSRVVRDNASVDLSDYSFLLDDNSFDLKIVLVYRSSGSTTVIPPGSSVTVSFSFVNQQFAYIKGFLGDQTAALPEEELEFSFFSETLGDAQISLVEPKVDLALVNGNGIPCVVDFTRIEARRDGQAPLPMQFSPANPITINHPTVMGESATTSVTITNVKELLDYAPSSFVYAAEARINPGLTTGNNFLLDSSTLRVRIKVEIPLYGHASGISLKDTVALDLSDEDASQVTSAALKLKITNELPLNGNIQLYLTDKDYNVIETLLLNNQTNIIKGSTVSSSGELQTAGIFDELIELDEARLQNVFKAAHVIVEATLETSRNSSGAAQDVKFKSSYGISIEAGIRANLKLSIR